jgi:mRNA interferase RelE/StbE
MSGYGINFSKNASKDLKKLDRLQQKRIIKKFKFFLAQEDPLIFAESLKEPFVGLYKWRIGNYRSVFSVEKKMITVLRVQHRSEVYKR